PRTGAPGPCSDHKTDKLNCGSCGNSCLVTQSCINGVCTTPNSCPVGQFICTDPRTGAPGPCSDHLSDKLNCGSCGNSCFVHQSCINGQCTSPGCSPGQFTCINPDGSQTACSDHQSDNNNCGFCGNLCAVNEVCLRGQCSPN